MSQAQIVPGCEVILQAEEAQAIESAPSLLCCQVTRQADEAMQTGDTASATAGKVVQAGKAADEVGQAEEVAWASKKTPNVPNIDEPRSVADDSGVCRSSDCEAPVVAICSVATEAGEVSIEAPPGLRKFSEINVSVGDVVETTTAAKVNGIGFGGWHHTLGALKSALEGTEHSTSGPDVASSAVWGCPIQRTYSNSLLLAHRSVYFKISQGAPGLQRIQDPFHAAVQAAREAVLERAAYQVDQQRGHRQREAR